MNSFVGILLLGLVALSFAGIPHHPIPHHPLPAVDYYAYPRYQYSYGVNDGLTGDHKTASEVREGGVVKGSYSFLQPDGIQRTVQYVSDPIHGFQAKVINTPGVAVHSPIAASYHH